MIIFSGIPIETTGRISKILRIHDEEWTEGQIVKEPDLFIDKLLLSDIRGDIFTFCQKLPETEPKYNYYYEWDNAAAIPLTSYQRWWAQNISQDTRRNVRLAYKKGVEVSIKELDDELVKGIANIYNEVPIRQGKKFKHYGKTLDIIRKEHATLLDRSIFICATHKGELIGFIKLVLMGPIAGIINIVSKTSHYDKRPANALISKAVEEAIERGAQYLTYIKFQYGNKMPDSLAEFKRRNGFIQINYPRYYVPLNSRGRLILKLKLHREPIELLPAIIIRVFNSSRALLYELSTKLREQRIKNSKF